jgi:hypothetical protein
MFKKIQYIGFALLISGNVYAEDFLYCPDTIECTAEGHMESCKIIGDSADMWFIPGEGIRVAKGIYKLKINSIISSYQLSQPTLSYCGYINDESGKSLTVESKHAFLEAYIGKNTKWIESNGMASCIEYAKNIDCPFSLTNGVGVHNNMANQFHYLAYGNEIKVYQVQGDGDWYIDDFEFNEACAGMKECQMDIFQTYSTHGDEKIGTVIIDTLNKMKILKIINTSPGGKERIKISIMLLRLIRKYFCVH